MADTYTIDFSVPTSLHQPTHPHPYLECVLKGTINFNVIINPKDIIIGYKLLARKKIDIGDEFTVVNGEYYPCLSPGTDFGSLFSGLSATLTQPIYGTEEGAILSVISDKISDWTGEIVWYVVLYGVFSTAHSKKAGGDVAQNIRTLSTPYYSFKIIESPKIEFNVENIINTSESLFSAKYKSKGENIESYKFSLYKNNELIDETPEKYESVIQYKYQNFLPGDYKVALKIKTENGYIIDESREFEVEYENQESALYLKATPLYDDNCIELDYSDYISVAGNIDSNYSFEKYKFNDGENIIETQYVSIPPRSTLSYNKVNELESLKINNENFTAYYYVHFNELFYGNIITLTDSDTGTKYNIRYDGDYFYYKIGLNNEVRIDPYVNSKRDRIISAAINPSGTTVDNIISSETDEIKKSGGGFYSTTYRFNATDILSADKVLIYNDITANHWWLFVLYPNRVEIYKDVLYQNTI